MAKCRVWYRADGGISVTHADFKFQRPKETDAVFLNRVFTKAGKAELLEGATFDDVDDATLPARDSATRDKWRKHPSCKGVHVDNTIVTPAELRKADEDSLDAELLKPNSDIKKVAVLQRKLQKGAY